MGAKRENQRRLRHVGALFAGAPAPFLFTEWLTAGADPDPGWMHIAAGASATALVVGALFALRGLRSAATLAIGGFLGSLAIVAPTFVDSPAMLLGATVALVPSVWGVLHLRDAKGIHFRARDSLIHLAIGAGVGALVVLGLALLLDLGGRRSAPWAALASFGVFCATSLVWTWNSLGVHPRRCQGIASLLALAGLLYLGLPRADYAMMALGFCTLTVLLALPRSSEAGIGIASWVDPILGHPERLLVATFVLLCGGGTFLLLLPIAATEHTAISFIDAAFTSVSAVCVTGLTVLDTPKAFSAWGQAFLAGLIQLGGLGIMTFSTAALRVLGRRLSLRHEAAVAGLMSAQDRSQLYDATRRLLLFTFGSEAVGALFLLVGFLAAGEPSDTALWRAVFTSVSAFCNAGFALQTDNLIPYQTNPLVLHTVAALITLGGLSPAVALAAPRWLRRQKTTPISVQAKLALVASLVLAVVGAIFFLAAEWSGSLAHLSFGDRLHNAWFHSVTLRTAGFNSVDMLALSPATVAMSLPWMFIGGSPGGTAGGVKTTTAAILLLAVIAAVTGRDRVVAGGRTIPHRTVYKAAAITTVGAATVFVAFVALLLTQTMPWHVAIFEVVSATGTVGLTIGGTPALDDIGKLVVMACMFAGRVGPLTLFMFVSQRTRRAVWERPEEDLDVG